MTSSSWLAEALPRQRVEGRDPLNLVTEQLDADGVLLVGGVNLDGVSPDPELAPHQVGVIALVLHVDQPAQNGALVIVGTSLHVQDALGVLLRRAQTVDAADRRHHDGVAAGEQRRGGRVAQPVDLVVDGAVLLDIGVAGGEIGLGLVVVVVADEVLHPVLREELAHLVGQLGGQRLVGSDDERGTLHRFDRPGDGGALAAPGDAEQRLEAVAADDALRQLGDRGRLIAGRREVRDNLEPGHQGDGTGRL